MSLGKSKTTIPIKNTPLLTLIASLPFVAVLAGAPPEIATQPQDQKVAVGQTPTPSVLVANPTLWIERLRNPDGSMNWTEYANLATHAGELAQRDYLLGPKYAYYHPTAESFPTLALQGDADGWEGAPEMKAQLPFGGGPKQTDWYAQAGPLLYVADDPNNAGVIEAGNGEVYIYKGKKGTPPSVPPYGFYNKVNWLDQIINGQPSFRYRWAVPPELAEPDWNSPKRPIAVATATGIAANQAIYVAFENGFIGTVPVDPIEWTFVNNGVGNHYDQANYAKAYANGPNKSIFPSVQLPAGKVPMALAVTPCGEFVLAAVWDVVHHKGQLAVIAVQGRVRCSETTYHDWNSLMATGTWMYGVPCWPTTKGLKLLGYVDLPIAAPTAIKAGTSMGWQDSGRWQPIVNANVATLLDNQSERTTWHDSDPTLYPNYKATAHAGYAIIASRSENRVVFVDLKPLLQYYRKMYFTTQALYDETKNVGPAANQWPYTFANSLEQMPVVATTLDVQAPTAVAAGLSIGHAASPACGSANPSWQALKLWRVTPSFGDQYAYITTMDGSLLMYNVGGLNTEAAPTTPVLYKTVAIGKNPSSMENGNGGVFKNDIFINCRGDKSVYALQPSGDIQYVLRDSRINDPVMAESSYNGRGATRFFIHVVDFTGKQVHTYVNKQNFPEPMKFGASTEVPGHPFAYQQDEVP
jgi:hypothetical protein